MGNFVIYLLIEAFKSCLWKFNIVTQKITLSNYLELIILEQSNYSCNFIHKLFILILSIVCIAICSLSNRIFYFLTTKLQLHATGMIKRFNSLIFHIHLIYSMGIFSLSTCVVISEPEVDNPFYAIQ